MHINPRPFLCLLSWPSWPRSTPHNHRASSCLMHLCSTPHYPWDELGSKQGSLQCCLDPRPHVMSTHASCTRSKPPWLLLLQRGLRNPILLLVLPASLEVLPDAHCPMSCFQTSWHLGVFSMVPSLHCGHRSGSPLHKRMDVTDTHCLWISYHQIHPRNHAGLY